MLWLVIKILHTVCTCIHRTGGFTERFDEYENDVNHQISSQLNTFGRHLTKTLCHPSVYCPFSFGRIPVVSSRWVIYSVLVWDVGCRTELHLFLSVIYVSGSHPRCQDMSRDHTINKRASETINKSQKQKKLKQIHLIFSSSKLWPFSSELPDNNTSSSSGL